MAAEKVLESAVAGISQVAQVIAGLPVEQRENALNAAERSYRQTAQDLGYEEAAARAWAAAVMFRLRTDVEERKPTEKTVEIARGKEAHSGPRAA
jgi:hypothetical protein